MEGTLCLNMIVKDEAEIIEETLQNIIDHVHVDYFVIADTGSSDNTVEKIKKFFAKVDIPGEVHEDEWVNFAHNRNLALDYALGKSDYIMVFDADDRLTGEVVFPEGEHDAYYFHFQSGLTDYERIVVFRNEKEYRYKGVLHEVLYTPADTVSARIESDCHIIHGTFGARSNDPDKYAKDAEVLVNAYYDATEPDFLKPRYAFYAAQSYRDAGSDAEAITWYQRRIDLGGWRGEVTNAYLNLGRAYKRLGKMNEAIRAWLEGYNSNTLHAECMYELAMLLSEIGNKAVAYQFLTLIQDMSIPTQGALFIHKELYRFYIKYQIVCLGHQTNHAYEGYQAAKKILFRNKNNYYRKLVLEEMSHYYNLVETDYPEDIRGLQVIAEDVLSVYPSAQVEAFAEYLATLPATKG